VPVRHTGVYRHKKPWLYYIIRAYNSIL